jgi:dihydroorotate dehydrogenase electron transfer subunit
MRQFNATVVKHEETQPRHFRMRVLAGEVARTAQAGQFVHVLPRQATYSFDPLLRRAFSIAAIEDDIFDIIYRVEGRGTALLSRVGIGDSVDMLGPLGVPFASPPSSSILVGGGVGVPPMAMLAAQYKDDSTRNMTAVVGARSQAELICLQDFERAGVPVHIATDDGSAGAHGRVTDLLEPLLTSRALGTERSLVYACGPLPMLRAVAKLCAAHDLPCQVSLEECMPCGVGVCNGCVVPVREASDDYGLYRRVCVDGPVMWAHEVNW